MKFETKCVVTQVEQQKNLWLMFFVEAETFGEAEEKTFKIASSYGENVVMKAVKLSNIDSSYKSPMQEKDNKWHTVSVQYLVDLDKEKYAITHYLVEAENPNEAIAFTEERIIGQMTYDATIVKVEETKFNDVIE